MTDRQIVRKSYQLITAKNNWNEIESKLLATFIKELNPKNEDDFRELKISIDSIQKLWGVKVDVSHIRKLCIELKRKVYEIPEYHLKDDGSIDENRIKFYDYLSLFSDIKYHLNEKYISFKFDNKMKPHLLEFSRFIKYKIENILQFNSSYSISFYEYFKAQMFKKETIKKIVLEIDYIHKWLQLSKSYLIYGNLKKKILVPVENDLKKHSDIYFNFQEIKTGRKVTHIEFNITLNVDKAQREGFFSDEELENKFTKYIGKSFIYNGTLYESIKVITPIDDFYKVTTETYDIKIQNLKILDKLIETYRQRS